MESSLKELAGYRMEHAKEMLSAAEGNLEIGQYKTSLNRSYVCNHKKQFLSERKIRL